MKSSDDKYSIPLDNQPLLKNIFIYTPVATAIISGQSTVVALNIAFQTLFQLSDDEVTLPAPFEDVISSFWKKEEVQHHLRFITEGNGEPTEKVFDWQHEDGSLKYIQIQSQLLPASQSQFLLTFHDVSAVKLVEKKHNEHIRHMMHELRNPLSNISLCVELLADSTKENNQEDTDMFLTKASASVQRMKQLINDLSAASKNA